MRIVSLLPAATEWIAALGAASELVGRSHECDEPLEVKEVPVITRPRFAPGGPTEAISQQVQEHLRAGLSPFDVDLDRLRALRPDLILTQAQCEVCAVSRSQLEEALVAWTDSCPHLLSLSPMTLKQALGQALRIGRALGRIEAAMQLLAEKEKRLKRLRERMGLSRTADAAERPTVACIEWLEPLMTAGHWMPDVVEMAGGRAVLTEQGAPSRRIAWEELCRADPDVVAVMPCGFTLADTRRDLHHLAGHEDWAELRAVRNGRVYLFDGSAYFNRPGPRLYRAVELLATALHPGRMESDGDVQAWERRALSETAAGDGVGRERGGTEDRR